MGANSYNVKDGAEGMVLEMEHRRKSGRSVHETYYLPPPPPSPTISITPHSSTASRSPATSAPSSASSPSAPFQHIIPLSTHPLFRPPPQNANESDKEAHGATFNLRLTDKQRKEREGVVLPFLDAQRPGLGGDYGGGNGGGRNWGEGEWEGRGEGGRILYDMGVEDLDDFDEEEDEI